MVYRTVRQPTRGARIVGTLGRDLRRRATPRRSWPADRALRRRQFGHPAQTGTRLATAGPVLAVSTEPLDLGHDHTVTFTSTYGEPDGDWLGAIVSHRKPDGTPCLGGSVLFEVSRHGVAATESQRQGRHTWQVQSWEPPTLWPSLRCRLCGDHGWVREGRWVAAP
jgi:hypothetical protein